MRRGIIAAAVVCYAAALAVAWAARRVPFPPPRAPEAAVAEAALTPPAPPPAPVPDLPTAPSPPLPTGQLQSTVDDLAREQAASRELVSELRATVAQLQKEIARQGPGSQDDGQQGRTVIVLCCDLLPPGQETLGPGAKDMVRTILPEILADTRQLVSVEGHSDSRPIRAPADKPFKDNADLSLLRARAVAALLRQHGVAAARIRVKGWGDTRPLGTNDTAEGRNRNRRVEVRLVPPSPGR